jgi:hypothetical protein
MFEERRYGRDPVERRTKMTKSTESSDSRPLHLHQGRD